MIKIEINGQVVEAQEGDMLIDVADSATIAIPRFCYHKKLSIAANCRMCLVEVEGAPKPVPACATPVTDGMKVNTKSPRALAAQKAVMEFLLINHPLDCPICDQGGECELQDVAMDYGSDVSQYSEAKRILGDRDVGPLIHTDMTRCIHCTRCVRFGEEVAGLKELGATGRSEWMEIGTYIKKSIVSELSGNVIDLCPVGALTSKPFRYKARAWELKSYPSIAPHDSLGSNVLVHTRNGEVMRVVPNENESINETWLSDRDRFSYEALNSASRLLSPQVKDGSKWLTLDWEVALETLVTRLKPYLNTPNEDIAVLLSPNLTLEELYLVQKISKALGLKNLEYRLRQQDFSIQGLGSKQKLSGKYAELEDEDAILMIGSYLRKEIPLLNNRVRKAQLAGAAISVINPLKLDYNYTVAAELVNEDLVSELAGVVKAACDKAGIKVATLSKTTPTSEQESLAQALIDAKSSHIMLGAIAQSDANYSLLVHLAELLAQATKSKLSDLPQAANSCGANMIFADLETESVEKLLANKKAIINFGVETADLLQAGVAQQAMQDAKFVASFNTFDGELQRVYSDLILPIGIFAENAGTYINAQGDWQSFKVIANSKTEAKPLWKLLRVLGNMLDLAGFKYVNTTEILDEIKQQEFKISEVDYASLKIELKAGKAEKLVSPYQVDSLVRYAPSLQATPDAQVSSQSE